MTGSSTAGPARCGRTGEDALTPSRTTTPVKTVTRILAAFWLCIVLVVPASLGRAGESLPFIVIERQSGAVLLHNRAFERWYPASLTKLMTVYVTLRAIRAGEIADGSPVVMSKNAAGQPPSRMGFAPGTKLRVDTALRILIVKSANDVAVALAESVAGSVPLFVERMNAEAARLGMDDTHFANPNGLHAADQYVSARDIALLARQILVEFPQFAGSFAVPAIEFDQKVHYSYNLLLERFAGADGMKTGFICASGYNFVASATRHDRQLVAVVFGAFSQGERAVEGARLLLQGFESTQGPAIDRFRRSSPPAGPESQRSRMCSESAWKQRYDPGAGDAVVDSALLEPRQVTRQPLPVSLGGIDAEPSEAYLTARLVPHGRLPVPEERPDYVVVDVDGDPVTGPSAPVDTIPVPQPRPQR